MSERDRLMELAERHGLTADTVDELRALLVRPAGQVSTLMLPDDVSEEAEVPRQFGLSMPSSEGGRYTFLERIGRGGTSDIWRVRDDDLMRTMAMKVLDDRGVERSADSLARFLSEAQATAQLQHPAIVPVHELGTLPDGRLYFTMEEVRGRTLDDVVGAVHAASQDVWSRTDDGWSLRRLVEAFRRVCEAVAYAHSRGVVHRDLKPANVMVGAFGEVKLMDWGLARLVGAEARSEPLHTARSDDPDDALMTRNGTIAGTPMYMAPEQAAGNLAGIDARTDVWSLGAVLYHLLKGRPPYADEGAMQVLFRVVYGAPDPLHGRPDGPLLPGPLVEIVGRAMQKEPADRYPDAGALAADIANWLDGAERREAALRAVEAAALQRREAVRLRKEARARIAEAAELLAGVQSWSDDADKAAGWEAEDAARRLESEARGHELAMERELGAAFAHVPDLPEAHVALARLTQRRHEEAERAGDVEAMERCEAQLRHHLANLAPEWPGRSRIAAYVDGQGRLSLQTEPAGARVRLLRFELQRRRLVPCDVGDLGTTPLVDVPLAMGSYVLELGTRDRGVVRYPLQIRRGLHWDGGTVRLPRVTDPRCCYVPAGPFLAGGDGRARHALPGSVQQVGAFFVMRDPVTNVMWREWLQCLDDAGDPEEADLRVPRSEHDGSPRFTRVHERWSLVDADGRRLPGDAPVVGVSWFDAESYAQWLAGRDSLPWRLPTELEWEKAAGGVDGRAFPWGDSVDPSWCAMLGSVDGDATLSPVGAFDDDVGPYGVRGMAGNVSDWCADSFDPAGRFKTVRGGSYLDDESSVRCAARVPTRPGEWHGHVGLRLVRSLV